MRRLLRAQRSSRWIDIDSVAREESRQQGFGVVAVVRASHLVFLSLRIEGYSLGNTWPLSYWIEFQRRRMAAELACRLTPHFGIATEVRHRDGEMKATPERLRIDYRSNGWTRVGTELNFMVNSSRPAPSLIVADISYFFDRVLQVGAGRTPGSPKRLPKYGGQRLLGVPDAHRMVSRYACPQCGSGIESYSDYCEACDWPRATQQRSVWKVEVADT